MKFQISNDGISFIWYWYSQKYVFEGNYYTQVAGHPLKAYKELNYIDYYVFIGEENSASIFWKLEPLFEKVFQNIHLYALKENGSMPIHSFESLKMLPRIPTSSIVLTDQHPEDAGRGLHVLNPDISMEAMERKVVYQYFRFSTEEIWLVDVLTQLVERDDSNTLKGNELIQELKGNLSLEEWTQYVRTVVPEDSLSVQKLDELLTSLKEKGTNFFSLNRNQNKELFPLYYLDLREILIKDTVLKDQHAILFGDEMYIPFIETMSALGFKINTLASLEINLIIKDHIYITFILIKTFLFITKKITDFLKID